jgi:hypothetical protein
MDALTGAAGACGDGVIVLTLTMYQRKSYDHDVRTWPARQEGQADD